MEEKGGDDEIMKVISIHIGAPLDRNVGREVGEAPANMMNMIIGV